MRNRHLIFITLCILSVFAQPVIAQVSPTVEPEPTVETVQETTPSVSPTETLDDEVDKLKEKVAEKVLGLKEKNDKATAGIIKSIGDTMVITTSDGRDMKVSLDSTLTSYHEVRGTAIAEIKKENFKKGEYVFVLGPEINGVITGNAIYKDQKYLILSGKITEVDADNFSVNIITLDKTTYTLDVQTNTTQQMLNIKTFVPERIGFSKLKEGDSIHVVVEASLENPKTTRYDAEKLLIIPNEYFIH